MLMEIVRLRLKESRSLLRKFLSVAKEKKQWKTVNVKYHRFVESMKIGNGNTIYLKQEKGVPQTKSSHYTMPILRTKKIHQRVLDGLSPTILFTAPKGTLLKFYTTKNLNKLYQRKTKEIVTLYFVQLPPPHFNGYKYTAIGKRKNLKTSHRFNAKVEMDNIVIGMG